MIGRGTRLCENLGAEDPLDGYSKDKTRFFIFDWCRNFEFFRENPKTVEGKVGVSLAETVFARQATLVHDLQKSAFSDEDYQQWRGELIGTIHYQVVSLNEELVSVRLHRQAVEKFKQEKVYEYINDSDLGVLITEIAPLVHNDESDVDALRFDAFMYGFMCSLVDGYRISGYANRLTSLATQLLKMATIPQVKDKLSVLEQVVEEHCFDSISALELERVRRELRDLIRFLQSGSGKEDVVTHLDDPMTTIKVGIEADPGEDFSDYKLKVERYFRDYQNSLVIQKLHRNIPMTEREFGELERIFTHDLGSSDDYERAYGDTPFGLLVRKLVKLDHEAAMEAFADFINSENLTEQQISFVHKVVNYVVENGYIEPAALAKPPFDRPQSFVRMFDSQQQLMLISIINKIKENAEKPAA